MLVLLWHTSLILITISVFLMLCLFVYRIYRTSIEKQFKSRQKQLTYDIFNAVTQNIDTRLPENSVIEISRLIRKSDNPVIISFINKLLPSLSGEEKKRLINILESIKIPVALRQKGRSRNIKERIFAIQSLAYFDDSETGEYLWNVLKTDRSPAVRLHAIVSLHTLRKDYSLKEALTYIFEMGTPPVSAFKAFIRSIAPLFYQDLVELSENPDLLIASIASESLGYSNNFEVIPHLILLCKADKRKEIRLSALRALCVLEHPRAEPAVAAGLTDELWEIRSLAAVCTGKIIFIHLIPNLLNLLNDSIWWVRYRSAEALIKMGDSGIQALSEWLLCGYPQGEAEGYACP
ncbi:MAG TPA: hypothetical protein VHO70_14160 [Chitinispirillaceae bacterium]|nr:hypothetical protein [Chitinispirillaceae bacterium]